MGSKKSNRSNEGLLLEIEELNSQIANTMSELNALKEGKDNPDQLTEKNQGQSLSVNKSLHDALAKSEIMYSSIYNSMSDGMAIHEILYNESGKASDYVISDVNPAFARTTGIDSKTIIGKKATDVYSLSEAPFLNIFAEVASSGVPQSFETYFTPLNKYFQISVFSHEKGKFSTIFQDISERKLISDTQSFLLNNSYASPTQDFFESLAKFLAEILVMDYVCIDKLEGDNLIAKTVAIYNDGKFDTNITYTLKETPCGDVVGKTICCFPRNVCTLFPNDHSLSELSAEGYIGTTLWSFTGKPIGLIAVIGRKPIENPHTAEMILKLVATRAAAELERRNAQEVIFESEDRFLTFAETVPVLVCVTSTEDSVVLFTNELNSKAFGFCGKEIIGTKGPDFFYDPDDRIKMVEMLKKNGRINNFQLKVKKRDGTPFWIMTSVHPIIYHSQPARVVASIDITDFLQTEEKLRASEERFRAIAENIPDLIIRFDRDLRLRYGNPAVLGHTGLNFESLAGKTVSEYGTPTDAAENWERTAREVISSGEPRRIEQINNWNGSTKVFDALLVPEMDISGNVSSIISIARDITEKKKAEEALNENQSKLRSVLNATLESIYMFDRNGIICMSNSTGIERLKRNNEQEIIGHHFSEFMPPELASARQNKIEEVFANGNPLEYEDERDSCIYHHSYFPVSNNNEVLYVVTYSTDITDRKRAESILMESEDRFRTIAESLTVMISIIRVSDLVIIFTNEPFERTFGFGKDEIAEIKYPDNFYYPDDFKNIREILKGGGVINNREVLVKKPDGSLVWIMLSIRKINFLNEPSYISILTDISETKRSQLELIRLNRLLNAHRKSSQAMMHSENEIDYTNEVCKIIIEVCGHSMVWVGYAQNDEFKSVVPVAHFGFDNGYIDNLNISWDDNEQGRGPTGTAIRTGKYSLCRSILTDPAFKPWRKAALERGFASSLVMPLISDGKPFGAISIYSKETDPFSEAEIYLIQELADDLAYGISVIRLTESERAAARAAKENEAKLKELVATKDKFFNIVAHDLKNPFTSLLGSSELLYENIKQMRPDNIKDLALILNDSARGGYAILQNLLDWSRSQTGLLKFYPENLNLRNLIDENIDNVKLQATNKEIIISSELKEDLLIYADKNMINTVLRNLLSNAVKYTYKKGSIVIKVTNINDEVIITVKDSGIGISKEKAETLFRIENSLSLPGTEKEQGTGLGLKLCKEFAEKIGGRIWVESDAVHGSEFKFTIPFNESKA